MPHGYFKLQSVALDLYTPSFDAVKSRLQCESCIDVYKFRKMKP